MMLLRVLTIALLTTASLGQLNRLFIGDASNIVLYANDLAMGLIAGLYLVYALISRRSWRIPIPIVLIWLWLSIGLLGLVLSYQILSQSELIVSLSYSLRYLSYSVLFFVSFDAWHYARSQAEANRWLYGWAIVVLLSAVLVALSGFIQLYVLPDLALLARYGWDPHLNRLVTSMLDPNYASCYLCIATGLGISWYLYTDRLWHQALLLPVIAVLVVAILLTFSRSGYVMLAIVLSIIAVVKSRSLLLVGIIIAGLAFTFVPRIQERVIGAIEGDATTSTRVISWQNSLMIAGEHPIVGVGFNAYRYAQDRYGVITVEQSGNAGAGADSSWLFVLATTGVIGLIIFIASYLGLAWLGFKAYLRSGGQPLQQAVSLAFLAALAGLAVASQFNNALFYTWILEPYWILAGLAAALAVDRYAQPTHH